MNRNDTRKQNKKALGMLTSAAIIFANAACSGKMHEPKVPSKLKK